MEARVLRCCSLLLLSARLLHGFECSPGCDPKHGFCEEPGECRCRPGWHGSMCDRCEPLQGCQHGACQEAWQCICHEGWSGRHCERDMRSCSSSPCSANTTCIDHSGGGYTCVCAPGNTGHSCQLKAGLCIINGSRCRPLRGPRREHRKMVRASERVAEPRPLVTRSQLICFAVLGLLTCMVVLGTTTIIFLSRCQAWAANAKYSQLLRQRRGSSHAINVILPEKIKLNSYGNHYTSM